MSSHSFRSFNIALFSIALALSSCSPSSDKNAAPQSAPSSSPAAAVTSPNASPSRIATVVFLSGRVRASVDGSERSIELGSELPLGATIATSKDSRCDLQLGSLGTIRVQPESTVLLKDISVGELRRVASTKLVAGAVAAKVSKLAASDRFDVSTPSAVFGVRGTEFVVRAEAAGRARVSVKEGSVALLPPSFDAAALEAKAKDSAAAPALDAIFAEALAKAPKVEASEEASVAAPDLASASKAWERVEALVAEAAAKPAEGAAATAKPLSEAPALQGPMAELAKASAPLAKKTKKAGPESVSSFDAFSAMSIGEAPASLVPLEISCEPADASISIDGAMAGIGSASLLKPSGTKIMVIVTREGYEDHELEIALPARGSAEKRRIELKAKAPAAPTGAQASAGPAAAAPAEEAAPPNAASPIAASFKAPASPLAARIQAGAGRPVGSCVATPDGAVFADEKGFVYRVSTKALLWKAPTGNALAACASPEVAQGAVYLEGDKNLSIISLAKGSPIATVPLDAEASGLFGRRPAIAGAELYLSASDGIRVLDAATGKSLRSIALPEGSDMSPRLAGGGLLLADRAGRFYKVDPAQGKPSFSAQSKAFQPVALAATVSGTRAFFADRKGLVSAVDLASGSILWSKRADEAGKAIFDDLVVAEGGVWAYSKGRASALSAETGASLMPALGDVAAPPFAAHGWVWVPQKGGRLTAYESATGKAIKSLAIEGEFAARPVEAEGLFICPLASGEVAIVDPSAAK